VGKRSLASVAAKALGWQALFADQIFVDLAKQDILSYVKDYGWDDFRIKEAQIITWLLSRYPTNTVIACSGGVVEHEENRRLLRAFGRSKGPVIYVLREREDVLSFLENSANSYPDYSRSTAAERWDIREQYYRECCSHEFVSLSEPVSKPSDPKAQLASNTSELISLALKPTEAAFLRLLRFIVGTDTNHMPVGPSAPRTFLLPLAFPDLHEAIPLIDEISVGIDCWEVRLDWLKSVDHSFVAFQIALLRRHSDLPIRFTVRTRSQGGGFPDLDDVEGQKQMYDLIILAYKLGCEYVDLELSWPEHMLASLLSSRGNTKIIGSWHDTTGKITWTGRETREIYEKGIRLGIDIIEIINTARSCEDNIVLRTFVEQVVDRGIPLAAFNMGPEVSSLARNVRKTRFLSRSPQGKLSRMTNRALITVSHPLLSSISAPEQISYAEAQSTLYLIGSLAQKSFYLFGSSITHALSQVLHSSAFAALTLPHTFTPIPAGLGDADLERIRDLVNRPDFGGGAVTIPLGIAAMNLCQRVSCHARVIGAVNVLIPIPTSCKRSSKASSVLKFPRNSDANFGNGAASAMYGENIDWRGIKTCIARCINPVNAVTSSTTALVIGAGGASRAAIYALHQLGVANMLIWNRTREKACALVDELSRRLKDPELGGAPFLQLGVLTGNLDGESVRQAFSPLPPPTIIISTIPASVPPSAVSSGNGKEESQGIGAIPDVGLRRDVLDLSPTGGVAVELACQPRRTPLLALVDQVNAFPAPAPRPLFSPTPQAPNQKGKQAILKGIPPPRASQPQPQSQPISEGFLLLGGKAAPWVGVEGIEILLEQGYEQVRLWTSRRAPKARIRNDVLREFERHVQQGFA